MKWKPTRHAGRVITECSGGKETAKKQQPQQPKECGESLLETNAANSAQAASGEDD